ncbi:hypothetical protein ADK75_10470 [Streptomyces virginiae]|uniref:DUF4383 domain-containing protein n=1 Tax=Streptomyces virginiae TaxID=1961 RepID=A0A0L8MZ10_STRVG|nr:MULTISPECIES: DUF4383 domain-containing protein [Streptomyces]KOG55598.1 hypothetical protein ADK75_10470 [Streptomyces virginiae]KOU23156.1 hypothetical protein ADK51_18515 [Streptomyces sp. WM6368]
MKLSDELPVDHHLATVYRYGALLCGLILLAFGILGFADALRPFDTRGETIAGMTTNTTLSVISVIVGLALAAGAFIGGNFASTLNITVGALFLLSGFAHIFVLDKDANVLGFGMTNVMFSFVMGLIIMTFGMYGRVSSKLSHDNPYWQRRHLGHASGRSVHARTALTSGAIDSIARAAPSDPTSSLSAGEASR